MAGDDDVHVGNPGGNQGLYRQQQQPPGNPAPVAAAACMLPQSEMSRLVVFRGNSKDTVTAEAWAEMVDRHISVLKWSPEQTAGAAIESMRDDANIWRENVANSPAQTKRDWLKDWALMRPEFLKRFGKAKTRAAKVQGLGQLRQNTGEACGTYQDRVIHALDKLTAKPAQACTTRDERAGFNNCRDLFEAAIFLNGLRGDIRMYIEMELKETSTADEIYELARTTEIALNSKTGHKVAFIDSNAEGALQAIQKEVKELKKSLETTEKIAAVTKTTKTDKPKDQVRNKPMAQRRPMLCWKCKQWGKHLKEECKLSADEIARLTPQSKDDRPGGEVFDAQYPNA